MMRKEMSYKLISVNKFAFSMNCVYSRLVGRLF
jgi:hypothetical protein